MYPDLHDNYKNITFNIGIRWFENLHDEYLFGLQTHITTSFWDKPCGIHCPSVWRCLDDGGTLVYRWHEDVGLAKMEDPIDMDEACMWRLASPKGCSNAHCINNGRVLSILERVE